MPNYTLYAAHGWGSMIAEQALALARVHYDIVEVGWKDGVGLDGGDLADINPLRQIPTLVLPEGDVMTRGPPPSSST